MKHPNRKRAFLLPVFSVLLVLSLLVGTVSAAVYRQGDSGSVVSTIQSKLTRWGYYNGSVDGIYGSQTVKAVKSFQSKNKLSVDGVAGDATLKAMGISSSGSKGSTTSSSSSGDIALLAKVISAEARGEPYSGQVAVGAVILNRIDHPSFPNSIASVVYEPGAFTCMVDGQIDQPIADSAYRAAQDAMNGSDPTGGAIYYFNPATATSSWIWSRPLITIIGSHRFCS